MVLRAVSQGSALESSSHKHSGCCWREYAMCDLNNHSASPGHADGPLLISLFDSSTYLPPRLTVTHYSLGRTRISATSRRRRPTAQLRESRGKFVERPRFVRIREHPTELPLHQQSSRASNPWTDTRPDVLTSAPDIRDIQPESPSPSASALYRRELITWYPLHQLHLYLCMSDTRAWRSNAHALRFKRVLPRPCHWRREEETSDRTLNV